LKKSKDQKYKDSDVFFDILQSAFHARIYVKEEQIQVVHHLDYIAELCMKQIKKMDLKD
jgi:hypothetical protein